MADQEYDLSIAPYREALISALESLDETDELDGTDA
jgi:hypothetical protein